MRRKTYFLSQAMLCSSSTSQEFIKQQINVHGLLFAEGTKTLNRKKNNMDAIGPLNEYNKKNLASSSQIHSI